MNHVKKKPKILHCLSNTLRSLSYEATFHCCCNKMETTSREDFVYIGGPKNISYKGAIIFCMSNTFNGNVILQCY